MGTAADLIPAGASLDSLRSIAACRPWLDREIELVGPRVVVCLGGTAAQALRGRSFRVTRSRGQFVEWDREPLVLATVHPSSMLRAAGETSRRDGLAAFVADLEVVAAALAPAR